MVSPLSSCVNGTWENLLNGFSAADKITRFDTNGYTTNYACEIKFGDGLNNTFFPDEWMDPKDQRKVDFFILYGVAAAEQAIRDSGWSPSSNNEKNRTGVMIGSGIGGLGSIAQTALQIKDIAASMGMKVSSFNSSGVIKYAVILLLFFTINLLDCGSSNFLPC